MNGLLRANYWKESFPWCDNKHLWMSTVSYLQALMKKHKTFWRAHKEIFRFLKRDYLF